MEIKNPYKQIIDENDVLIKKERKNNLVLQKKFDVVQCLERMNGSGIYQQRVLLLMVAMIFTISFSQYSLPFTFLNPQVYCYEQDGELIQCNLRRACQNKKSFVVKQNEFVSFQVQFEKICDQDYIDNIQTIILVVASVGSFILNFLQDIIGRTKAIYIAILIGIFSFYLSGFVNNEWLVVIGISLSLFYNDAICSCFYSYFPEVMGKNIRNKTSGIIFLSMTLVNITITYISNFLTGYQKIAQIGFFVNFIGLLVIIYFVETPLYYYTKKDIKNLHYSLKYIQKENEVYNQNNQKQLDREIEQVDKYFSQKKNKTNEYNLKKVKFQNQEKFDLFCLFFIDLQIYLTSFVYVLAPGKLGINNHVRVNLYITTIGEVIGYFLISIFSIKIPRRNFFIFYVNLSMALSCFNIILQKSILKESFSFQIMQLFISFMFKILVGAAFAMIYNYIAEIVRTEVRGMAVGIMVFSGRMIVSFLPFIINFQNNHNLCPFTFVLFISFLNQFFVYKLPQTLNKKIK